MKMLGPDPQLIYPIKDRSEVVFLKNVVKASNIIVGDYTYFDNRFGNDPEKFEVYNVMYNYDYSKVKLVIGKFCALAAETRFMMTGDHKLHAFSTYPFPMFQQGWEDTYDMCTIPVKGDIIVGNDVWFGYDSLIKNGVAIGNGAIIAARAVVVKDVPAYSIVAGNPAKVVKMRFDDKTIESLQKIAWWNWPIEKITKNLTHICDVNISKLIAASLET